MNKELSEFILQTTQATSISKTELVQSLWSGYGELLRVHLKNSIYPSVIVKNIQPPSRSSHPRGWNTDISHQRKLTSYEVELNWYENHNKSLKNHPKTPDLIGSQRSESGAVFILEDLNSVGYHIRKSYVSDLEINNCIQWLAQFHAKGFKSKPKGLWKIGCYWHLETRPDELEQLTDIQLKEAAPKIDEVLNSAKYLTIVHGDAKLANFCFSEQGEVAAVDFQYTGGGCGMKDLIYFLGSCLSEDECETHNEALLNLYFSNLKTAIEEEALTIDFKELETEWRALFPVAWADFHRFLKGWSPGHWKINSYSERITREVIEQLN